MPIFSVLIDSYPKTSHIISDLTMTNSLSDGLGWADGAAILSGLLNFDYPTCS